MKPLKLTGVRKGGQKGAAGRIAIMAGLLCLPLLLLAATGPRWWVNQGALDPSAVANDYAAINQGQLKNIARAAVAEFDLHLPGGADNNGTDPRLRTLMNSWASPSDTTDDYLPVNLAQLKTLAMPFYDRLIKVGYTTEEQNPWSSGTAANSNNYAMANIGQVKNLFSWDLALTGTDGLPAWWKNWWGRQLQTTINAGDIDPVTGLTYLQDFITGCTPGSALVTDPSDATALEVYTPLR